MSIGHLSLLATMAPDDVAALLLPPADLRYFRALQRHAFWVRMTARLAENRYQDVCKMKADPARDDRAFLNHLIGAVNRTTKRLHYGPLFGFVLLYALHAHIEARVTLRRAYEVRRN